MTGRVFHMKILGRTIEHLGTQMYKHRAPSLAELVANSWDAGAKSARLSIPEVDEYDPIKSAFILLDDGEGMNETSIQEHYLVVGLNRRLEDGGVSHGRKIMGRKGIGKLAGFGLAGKITITTWTPKAKKAIRFSMSLDELKGEAGQVQDIAFPWLEVDRDAAWPPSGTEIRLSNLRHTTPIEVDSINETLARRFSRTTKGQMKISVNGLPLAEPAINTIYDYPDEDKYAEAELANGQKVKYRYRFSRKPLRSKELQGFVIYANERTAQAPPFFFDIESTASAQHSTRYVTGEIIADYLDAGTDDESDVISTDRQELDWEKEDLKYLRIWGEELARKVLRECAEMRGKQFENWILGDEHFISRLGLLDSSTQKEISRFLKILGQKSDESDPRTKDLADSLIRAYEFRTFHDVIDDIEQVGDDADKLEEILGRLCDWKVLESRAILEIVRGRLSIIKKLEQMIIHNAPETASAKTYDNLHDLLAEYPWLFNPEWQVFEEEQSISKTLHAWGERDCPEDIANKRVDFLAFAKGNDQLVIIELKRPGHAVELNELQRLEQYQVALMKSRPNCRRVLIYGGNVNIPATKWKEMKKASDLEILTWSDMFTRASIFYSHYEAVLDGDVTAEGFQRKRVEVARTRAILESGSSYRSKKDRSRGVGDSEP